MTVCVDVLDIPRAVVFAAAAVWLAWSLSFGIYLSWKDRG